jgi:predicted metalloprotease
MMKLGKTGGKKGLAITGMILGLVAVILTTLLVMGIGKIQEGTAKLGDEFKDALEEGMNQSSMSLDSLANEMEKASDSLHAE